VGLVAEGEDGKEMLLKVVEKLKNSKEGVVDQSDQNLQTHVRNLSSIRVLGILMYFPHGTTRERSYTICSNCLLSMKS